MLLFMNEILHSGEWLVVAVKWAILFQMLLVICCLGIISIVRLRQRWIDRDRQLVEELTEYLVINFLSGSADFVKSDLFEPVKNKIIVLKNHQKDLLIQSLIEIRQQLSGDEAERVKVLYRMLELDLNSTRKINSLSWTANIRGLEEVTLMDYPIPDIDILKFMLSPIRDVRSTARCTFMCLSKNEPLRFLEETRDSLTFWELISFFQILDHTQAGIKSNFANLIKYSGNYTVVFSCIRLAAYERQSDAVQSISIFLDSKDDDIRAEAIRALGELQSVAMQGKLLSIYNSQPIRCKIEIIKAMGNLRNMASRDFLFQELLDTNSFQILNTVAKVLASESREFTRQSLLAVPSDKRRILKYYIENV